MTKERIEQLIREFNMHYLSESNQIQLSKSPTSEVLENLNELKEYFKAKLAEQKLEVEKIKNIESLTELEKAREIWSIYESKVKEAIYNDGFCMPQKPQIPPIEEYIKKYPRALTYLHAESWELSENYAKSKIGSRARERILNGEDYNVAIEEMEKEWTDYCEEHIWD